MNQVTNIELLSFESIWRTKKYQTISFVVGGIILNFHLLEKENIDAEATPTVYLTWDCENFSSKRNYDKNFHLDIQNV